MHILLLIRYLHVRRTTSRNLHAEKDLAALKPGLASLRANVPSKQVPSQRHYFAGAPLLHLGLRTAEDNCAWFKEIQTYRCSQTFFQH